MYEWIENTYSTPETHCVISVGVDGGRGYFQRSGYVICEILNIKDGGKYYKILRMKDDEWEGLKDNEFVYRWLDVGVDDSYNLCKAHSYLMDDEFRMVAVHLPKKKSWIRRQLRKHVDWILPLSITAFMFFEGNAYYYNSLPLTILGGVSLAIGFLSIINPYRVEDGLTFSIIPSETSLKSFLHSFDVVRKNDDGTYIIKLAE